MADAWWVGLNSVLKKVFSWYTLMTIIILKNISASHSHVTHFPGLPWFYFHQNIVISGLTRQLLVGEEDEVLYFKLPSAKKKQNKHKHDIMDAVDNARGAEKKH